MPIYMGVALLQRPKNVLITGSYTIFKADYIFILREYPYGETIYLPFSWTLERP